LHGESVVLRLLDKKRGGVRLADVGLADDALQSFSTVISKPHGIVLATGPTGSGKTTTLYAAIDTIRTGREKILTVEDPVEYELMGVPQIPVNDRVGMTFAAALRALLRQDPDVILVGEIRDRETAEIATHAALTGHLVLSSLHTNDAVGALTRLMDLGVAPYLVASTVEAVLAQRLVRVLCPECKESVDPSRDTMISMPGWMDTVQRVYRAVGCPRCGETGFLGRTGIYELLTLDDGLREALVGQRRGGDLRNLAIAHGMRTLREDGMRLIRAGVTTAEEVLRVTTT
jgi:general secretion pathway protein E